MWLVVGHELSGAEIHTLACGGNEGVNGDAAMRTPYLPSWRLALVNLYTRRS